MCDSPLKYGNHNLFNIVYYSNNCLEFHLLIVLNFHTVLSHSFSMIFVWFLFSSSLFVLLHFFFRYTKCDEFSLCAESIHRKGSAVFQAVSIVSLLYLTFYHVLMNHVQLFFFCQNGFVFTYSLST